MAFAKNPDRPYEEYREFEWDVGSATMTGELNEPHPVVPLVLENLKKHAKDRNKQKAGKLGIAETLRNLTLKQQILHFLKDGAGDQDSEEEGSEETKVIEMDEAQKKLFLQSVKEMANEIWGNLSPRRPQQFELEQDPKSARAKYDKIGLGGFFSIAS